VRSLLAWRPVHKVAPRTNLFTFVCSETVVEGGECLPLDSDIPRSSILDTSVRAPLLTHGAAATLYAPAFSRSSLSLYLVSPKGSGAAAGLHRGRLPTGVAPAAAAAHRCKVQRPSAVRRARRGRLHCAKGGSIVPTDMALSTAASLCRRCLVGVLQQPTAVARSAVRLAGEQRQLQRAVCME